MRFRSILETCQRKRYQIKNLTYQRRRMNCRIGMLINTYQTPAGVSCHRPPGKAYQVGTSMEMRLCQTHRPRVWTKRMSPTARGRKLGTLSADGTAGGKGSKFWGKTLRQSTKRATSARIRK